MLALVVLLAFALSGRRLVRVRRVPAWRSATIGVDGADSYTPFGYANPTRRVLASVLHTRAGVEELAPRRDGAAEGYDEERVPHLRYDLRRGGGRGELAVPAGGPAVRRRGRGRRSGCSPAASTPTCCTC